MPGLAAVVPATNAPPTLGRCLEAIRCAAEPPEELVVVERPAGAGPARARNEGARRAAHEILVFVDADVVVHADVFTRIRAAFAADPGLTALFGSYDDAPEAPGLVSGFRNLLHHHVHQRAAGPAATFWAGLGAVRRDAFLEVGGFDAARFPRPSIEDVELGMRLAAAGARIRLDPSVQGTHLKAWSLAEMVRTDFARRGVPWVALLLERRSASTALNLGWRHRASAAFCTLAVAAAAARRPGMSAACALAFVALNGSLYALLARRRGVWKACAGVPLHGVHHLTSVAALPAGALVYLRDRRRYGGLAESSLPSSALTNVEGRPGPRRGQGR